MSQRTGPVRGARDIGGFRRSSEGDDIELVLDRSQDSEDGSAGGAGAGNASRDSAGGYAPAGCPA